MGAAYSSLSVTKVLYSTSLVLLRLAKETKWEKFLKCVDPNQCYPTYAYFVD